MTDLTWTTRTDKKSLGILTIHNGEVVAINKTYKSKQNEMSKTVKHKEFKELVAKISEKGSVKLFCKIIGITTGTYYNEVNKDRSPRWMKSFMAGYYLGKAEAESK